MACKSCKIFFGRLGALAFELLRIVLCVISCALLTIVFSWVLDLIKHKSGARCLENLCLLPLLVLIAVLGFHGSFYKNQRSLLLLSLLTGAVALTGIASIIYISLTPPGHEKILADLANQQASYQWSRNNPIAMLDYEYPANKLWDTVQKDHRCCGFNGPHDWNDFRPSGVRLSEYPISCCSGGSNDYCKEGISLNYEGCRSALNGAEIDRLIVMGYSVFMAFISLMAILLKSRIESRRRERSSNLVSIDLAVETGAKMHPNSFVSSMY